ncbi:MAG: RnfABCDGE type electron transport complex subunit D [Firmicutes bacterium]|nr:RnfABCDGE type electron transport complex subunit D [Bacillota bacterium]
MAERHTDLIVASAPHVCAPANTASIMRDVLIALVPALAVSVYVFGIRSLVMAVCCIVFCVFFEWLVRKIMKRDNTIGDLSAAVTGLILAFNLPVRLPIWMAAVGCFIAIVVVKQLFGGLGQNFANPAIVGRIALFIGFAGPMASWTINSRMSQAILDVAEIDATTGATPLGMLAAGQTLPSNLEMFLGLISGSMGEISAAALILGGIYLIVRKVISPAIPVSFLATVAVLSLVFGLDPIFQLCAGGVMLGAIFMATDYVTSPITTSGRIIFGIGCGLFTMLIRVYASYPEGVSFAILLMNILTPHIDRLTRHKAFKPAPEGGAAK